MVYYYQVDMDDLTRIERVLGMAKDKTKFVLRAAINEAAREVKNRLERGAKKRYTLAEGINGYRRVNKLERATTGRLVATLIAQDVPLDLTKYKVQPPTYFPGSKGAPKWIKAKTVKEHSLTRMAARPNATGDKYKGFVVRYRNGHIAFAERVPGSRMRGKDKEALKSLYAISKPKSEEMVLRDEVGDLSEMLAEHVQTQIARFLG